jgi:hypothetical protein
MFKALSVLGADSKSLRLEAAASAKNTFTCKSVTSPSGVLAGCMLGCGFCQD